MSSPGRGNDQQSFLFVISGSTPMTLTTNVPEADNDEQTSYCSDCADEDGISMVNNIPVSWIGHSARTIQRIIDHLRKRSSKAVVTVITLLGGIQIQLQNVSIQCEEQIEISLSLIETMTPETKHAYTSNLVEFLTKMNPTSILKKPTPRLNGSLFDQMYVFLCEQDLSSKSFDFKSTITLAPIVRWFIVGPTKLRASIDSLKHKYTPADGDFNILQTEDTVSDNLIDRLLPPPEEKPMLALGTKSAKFIIDSSSGVRTVEVLGFLPLGNVSSSNLAQFSYDEDFIYEIGQDPDYDETEICKRKSDIDLDYFGSFPEPDQQLLPLLLNGMMEEGLAAFCQVSLKEKSEYLMIKQALAAVEEPSTEDIETEKISENAMEIDDKKEEKARSHLPVYGVLFATTKNGYCYESPDDIQEVDSDEGPSDDEDIDDVIDEDEGKTVRLKLALLSPLMTRPGWTDIEQWTSEIKEVDPTEKQNYWPSERYETKSNRWMDDAIFTREVVSSLIKQANKNNMAQFRNELVYLAHEVKGRCMSHGLIADVIHAVIEGVADTETADRIRAMVASASSTAE